MIDVLTLRTEDLSGVYAKLVAQAHGEDGLAVALDQSADSKFFRGVLVYFAV
jgi:hypothetical protein